MKKRLVELLLKTNISIIGLGVLSETFLCFKTDDGGFLFDFIIAVQKSIHGSSLKKFSE